VHDKKGEPIDKAAYAANLRQNLEEIRLGQANSELKRFQLLKHLDSLRVSILSSQQYYLYTPFSLNSL
jgi:hypothetical protein